MLAVPLATLATRVRAGEIGAAELAAAAIDLAETRGRELGAVAHVEPEAAVATGARGEAGGPLAGIPFAVKDTKAWAGRPLTYGSRFMASSTARHTSEVVRRMVAAGAVPIAVSTTAEFGILTATETARYGVCRSPRWRELTAGGSSGGAAALVAAGVVPFAHANDGGGSIRIPAACCGIVGLKPSRGRVSLAPESGDSMLAVEGAVTRSVADAAAVLDAIAGPAPGDPVALPPPERPFAAEVEREAGRCRVAVCLDPPIAMKVERSVADAVDDAARALEGMGHGVETVELPSASGLRDDFATAGLAVAGPMLERAIAAVGRQPTRDELEPATWQVLRRWRGLAASELMAATARLQRYAWHLAEALAGFDVLLTPALPGRPPRAGDVDRADAREALRRSAELAAYMPLANLTGRPALVLPAPAAGDPRPVQLMADVGEEALLLRLGHGLESAGWRMR